MKHVLNQLHARVGDLWWYSAMLFIACRSGDVIQAFIGLWLVPKYVGPNELGAVLPLQQLSSFFTVPLAIVAVVFSKYVNTYATRGERGKVKSFIHDVILVSAALFLVCIAAAYWLIPHFYSRLNIAAGSLTILVLASGFVGNISNLFGSALQGLKKFKTMTVQSLISAPIRLVTLLIAMPFRPLSGYLLGQTTPAASCGLLAALSLHKDLRNERLDTSWRKDWPEIWRYIWPLAIYIISGAVIATVWATLYRQRLTVLESSAYYMLSRYAEIAGLFGGAVGAVLFPLAAERHTKERENPNLLHSAILATLIGAFAFAIIFYLTSTQLMRISETWEAYEPFSYLMPIMAISAGFASVNTSILSYEMACKRFLIPFINQAINAIFTVMLVSLCAPDYFIGMLPDSIRSLMISIHMTSLNTITYTFLIWNILQCTGLLTLKKFLRN